MVSRQLIFTQIFRVCAESHKLRFRFGTAQSRRVLATSRFLLELHGLLPTHNRARTALDLRVSFGKVAAQSILPRRHAELVLMQAFRREYGIDGSFRRPSDSVTRGRAY